MSCTFNLTGSCRYGIDCRFEHMEPEEIEPDEGPRGKEELWNGKEEEWDDGSDYNDGFRNEEVHDGRDMSVPPSLDMKFKEPEPVDEFPPAFSKDTMAYVLLKGKNGDFIHLSTKFKYNALTKLYTAPDGKIFRYEPSPSVDSEIKGHFCITTSSKKDDDDDHENNIKTYGGNY